MIEFKLQYNYPPAPKYIPEKWIDHRFPFPPHIHHLRTLREKRYKYAIKFYYKLRKMRRKLKKINQLTLRKQVSYFINYDRWFWRNAKKIKLLIYRPQLSMIMSIRYIILNMAEYLNLCFNTDTLINMHLLQGYSYDLLQLLIRLENLVYWTIVEIQVDPRNGYFIKPDLYESMIPLVYEHSW